MTSSYDNIPTRKTLNSLEETTLEYFGFHVPCPFQAVKAKSPQHAANKLKDATWQIKPASMMFFPMVSELTVLAVAAIPPPRAWRTKQIKSQVQKMMVYVRGLKRERFSP